MEAVCGPCGPCGPCGRCVRQVAICDEPLASFTVNIEHNDRAPWSDRHVSIGPLVVPVANALLVDRCSLLVSGDSWVLTDITALWVAASASTVGGDTVDGEYAVAHSGVP